MLRRNRILKLFVPPDSPDAGALDSALGGEKKCDPAGQDGIVDCSGKGMGLDARVLDHTFATDICNLKPKTKRGATKLFDDNDVISSDLVKKLLEGLTDRTTLLNDHEQLLLARLEEFKPKPRGVNASTQCSPPTKDSSTQCSLHISIQPRTGCRWR